MTETDTDKIFRKYGILQRTSEKDVRNSQGRAEK
jgi:hypothetical protein